MSEKVQIDPQVKFSDGRWVGEIPELGIWVGASRLGIVLEGLRHLVPRACEEIIGSANGRVKHDHFGLAKRIEEKGFEFAQDCKFASIDFSKMVENYRRLLVDGSCRFQPFRPFDYDEIELGRELSERSGQDDCRAAVHRDGKVFTITKRKK